MMYLYHLISFLILPFYLIFLIFRVWRGRENIGRILERFGISLLVRPSGTLVWFHAASVGESLATITLMNAVNQANSSVNFLITSGTKSSAEILKDKLPKNAIHQFLPGDNIIFVQIFLRRWRPNIAIFIESEIWPCLLSQSSQFCNLLLMNARISDKSFAKWSRYKSFFQACLKNFSQIVVQSERDLEKFQQLGIEGAINLGNIKFANKKLEVDTKELLQLSNHFQGKKIIVAASTHAQDEAEILPIILPIKQKYSESYFILIPRHPERKAEILANCLQRGLKVSFRTDQKIPDLSDDLYIADTFGELGLFYRLCYIAYVGGSFAQGGHSPVEPAHFAKLVIFGPDMSNASAIASEMIETKAAVQINDAIELREKLEYFLSESGFKESQNYSTAAINFIARHGNVLQNYLAIIQKYLK